MKAKEKALKALSKYSESYKEIDPLIEPLCKVLTENGYITMHSCSTHVKVQSFKLKQIIIVNDGSITDEQLNERIHNRYKQWYCLFIATEPISEIRRVIEIINNKYNYNLYCKKVKAYEGITRRWAIQTIINSSYKNEDIYELNKNIYLEFKKYFDKKECTNQ